MASGANPAYAGHKLEKEVNKEKQAIEIKRNGTDSSKDKRSLNFRGKPNYGVLTLKDDKIQVLEEYKF